MMDDMTWDHASVRECDWVPGCYFLIRQEVEKQVGLFDPRYFLYYEEVDLCFAIKKAGWQIHYIPDTTVVHIGGESAKADGKLTSSGRQLAMYQIESELLYFRKNHGVATVWLNILLHTLANFIVPFVRMLKCKRKVGWVAHWENTRLYWVLFVQTNFGIKPTR